MTTRTRALVRLAVLLPFAAGLLGFQSHDQRMRELARICADPENRRADPGNIYYDECQAIHPSSPRKLAKRYFHRAPEGY